jgi:hypothetical protein
MAQDRIPVLRGQDRAAVADHAKGQRLGLRPAMGPGNKKQ